ncbi:MAG TPA: DegQ family serine endoprotease [Steroidobacteraceae bacterium]|jgi:serine protease Do|nr:DegQ family serine endoprotease [Steroidobacteraceae bacterium]
MSNQVLGSRLAGAVVLVALFAACSPQPSSASPPATAAGDIGKPAIVPTAAVTPTPAATAAATRGLPDFADLVAQVGPAVVNVQVVEKSAAAAPGSDSDSDDDSDDPFGDFFRRFGLPRPNMPQQQPRNYAPVRGVGSGFIISPDGYILTNTHVVNNASKITVKLTDRREFEGKVVGMDERTDVAVIKIVAKGDLPVVKLGDSNKLRPGQWVLAIGSPFNFENSVTAGIVSALARGNVGESGNAYVPFIQTDVAVNPGNSGGPLFNLNGEVVGINSQIYSRSGGYEGISFAIPIDVASNVADQLIKNGHVSRGRIGVTIQEVTAATAENLGLDRPRGAAVASVESGGPADKAGIEPLDIILSVNGRPVDTSDQLPSIIAEIKAGQSAQLEVWRDKAVKKISVTVEELKDKSSESKLKHPDNNAGGETDDSATVARIGLTVRALKPDEKSQAKTRGSVVITNAKGPAAEGGLRSGDVILSVNRTKIDTVAQFETAIKNAGHDATLLVQREDQQSIITITLQ